MIEYMPTHLVNLDALIQREDFESGEAEANSGNEPLFKVEELASEKLYYKVLRKPDFQRETSNWDPETVVEFVRSFLDSELIPALILWHSKQSNKVFVIDGAHRLSALIAWVNEDYGDGKISKEFFRFKVPEAQAKFHKKTKALMDERIGTFAQLLHVGLNPDQAVNDTMLRRARAIATKQPPIQRVEGDAVIAEKSFFKINGNPTTIDPTELDIIRARKKPNAIATRALMRAGTGHKYWAKFPEKSAEIEHLASEVYELLFGQIVEIGAQSADVPRAGQPYSEEAFRMILDMVNLFNEITPAMWQHRSASSARRIKQSVSPLADDIDGEKTIQFLETIRSVGNLVSGNTYAGSLGLDPAVYSYGATGKFHSGAFLASLKFAKELKQNNKQHEFTDVRRDLEEFLVRHKHFINALGHSKGSRMRPVESLLTMHRLILEAMLSGVSGDAEIIARLQSNEQLTVLKAIPEEELQPESQPKRFSKSVQAAAVIRDTLAARARCTMCGARLAPFSRSKDHKQRLEDGGSASLDNLQFTHPYCNTGYKEKNIHEAKTV